MENEKLVDLAKKVSKNRDEGAFSDLFDFFAPKINAYYLKNNLSFEQSEELTQEVLSVIWTKADLFNPQRSKFITWVFTIARNKKIDLHRKNKNRKAEDEDVRLYLYQNNKITDYEVQSSIDKIKQELDENQQKLIKMSFFEQKSHKIIAQELEIPIGTVKSRIRSTLNKMQKFLS
ncbi:sigma-70 family RNA polymerase sigma factor [Pelagibacterales bacterium SAG-MED31]|nr:sigma-70 family RNA polymerase sigma factor [Pelagibacterales bacterium SAG-MED31]